MTQLTVNHVRIAGLSACVPEDIEENISLPVFKNPEEANKIIETTGIKRHRRVPAGVTASDLSVESVNKLVESLGWNIKDVDMLLYVCVCRDYYQPTTSSIMQQRLNMRQDCFVMDIPMGCSGWVYGMSVAASLMEKGTIRRGILVAADTNTLSHNPKDKTTRPLFGDAATATALEYDASFACPMNFLFGVDGTGAGAIMAKYGGFRHPTTPESLKDVEVEPGVWLKGTDTVMNGMDVFSFSIRRPPEQLRKLVRTFNIDVSSIDYLLLHQANRYIDERIRKSLGIPAEKTPYCLDEFGNVSSASIPLTMVSRMAAPLTSKDNHCLACGFGVGLQWGSMEFHAGKVAIPPIVEY